MISYKDMTFCREDSCVKFDDCPRSLTKRVIADAERWWGSKDAPVSVYIERQACYEGKSNE